MACARQRYHIGLVTHVVISDENNIARTGIVWSASIDEHMSLILPDTIRSDVNVGSWIQFEIESIIDDNVNVKIISKYNVLSIDLLPTRVADNGRVQVYDCVSFFLYFSRYKLVSSFRQLGIVIIE